MNALIGGVPLSLGRQEFPGTWTCCYHGWTYDLKTGVLRAALTDGPDSPICGKVRVRTYPVEERGGMIWVYMGDGEAPPVEEDLPDDFLNEDAVVVGRITIQRGDWRLAAENSFDTGHAFYLHRYGNLRLAFNKVPGWSYPKEIVQRGPWLSVGPRERAESHAIYPGLGQFPRYRPWHGRGGKPLIDHSIRLPGMVRLHFKGHSYVDILGFQPVDKDHYRLFQFFITRTKGLAALRFQIFYYYWMKWIHHVQFNNQDTRIVPLMPETSPNRFYRPDVSITRWRKLCEQARGEPAPEAQL